MNVHQCDVYQIDKYTYQIVADYLFQPATEVMINLYDSDGQDYDGEHILANDPNAKIATLDAKNRPLPFDRNMRMQFLKAFRSRHPHSHFILI